MRSRTSIFVSYFFKGLAIRSVKKTTSEAIWSKTPAGLINELTSRKFSERMRQCTNLPLFQLKKQKVKFYPSLATKFFLRISSVLPFTNLLIMKEMSLKQFNALISFQFQLSAVMKIESFFSIFARQTMRCIRILCVLWYHYC